MKKFLKYSVAGMLILSSCTTNAPSDVKTSPSLGVTPTTQAPLSIKSEDAFYYTAKKEVKGFIAYPEKPGKYPALVLIHEWWGLNDNIKENARKFASLGYVALTADLYEGKVTTEQAKAGEYASGVRNNTDEAINNLKKSVDFLKARADVNPEKMASVGWCFGGGWSYQMAKNDLGVKATVMYYGSFNPEDDLKMMKSHIIGHFGEKDMSIKVDDVKQFQATLKTISGDHEIYIYPNAGHGFANESNPNYVKEAADSAWQRTIDFLKKQL